MDWRVRPDNITTAADFWALWDADQDAFAAIGLTLGAERSGGASICSIVRRPPTASAAPTLPQSASAGRPLTLPYTVAALALLAWDIVATMDDEVRSLLDIRALREGGD